MEYSERRIVNISQGALMRESRAALTDKWGVAVPTVLIATVIGAVSNFIPFGGLLVGGPLALGLAMFFLKISRDQPVEINNLFDGFKNFGNAVGTYLLMIAVVLLGFVCLIIPGIILSFGLSQCMFILAEEPEIGPVEALKKSWEMMKGYKMDLFILGLYFIPWALLCLLTFGIGFFWLMPYYQTTMANFYKKIKFEADKINENDNEDDITKHMVDDLNM